MKQFYKVLVDGCFLFLVWMALPKNVILAQQQDVAPSVPRTGSLVLVGGGANRPAFVERFLELAGGANANVVVIPTSLPDRRLTPEGMEQLRTSSLRDYPRVTLLHTRDRKVADSADFVEPLRHCTGVWILGGNEEYLVNSYEGTRTEREIKALLARGGVVGGTSAGAIIQGAILIDGKIVDSPNVPGTKTVTIEPIQPGFNLLPDVMVFPHWHQNKQGFDLIPLAVSLTIAKQPGRWGLGIDEATAAVVQGNRLEVLGDGNVGIYDGKDHNGQAFILLSPGQAIDLKARTVLALTRISTGALPSDFSGDPSEACGGCQTSF
jgi:cyanophycinase